MTLLADGIGNSLLGPYDERFMNVWALWYGAAVRHRVA